MRSRTDQYRRLFPNASGVSIKCRRSTARTRSLTYVFILSIAALALCAPPAAAFSENGDLYIGASFRNTTGLVHNYRMPALFGAGNGVDAVSGSSLRITAEGGSWAGSDFELHAVQSLNYSPARAQVYPGLSGESPAARRYRAVDATLDWANGRNADARLRLDRFNLRFTFGRGDLTVGRQAVSFGKAYLWNPVDVFMPFDPEQFDRDYKAGVDALRYDYQLGLFSGLTFIYAPGATAAPPGSPARDTGALRADWNGSALLARCFGNRSGWDYSLQGGKVYGGHQYGAGLVGEAGPWQIRAEAARFIAGDSPRMPFPLRGDLFDDATTAIFGIGRYYRSSLDIELEYLYNGAGEPDNFAAAYLRQYYGGTLHMGRHIIGFMAGYEFSPLVNGQVVALHSLSDQSTQLQPLVKKSLTGNSDAVFGATLNFGRRPAALPFAGISLRSEFGSYPNTYFSQYKIYF